jgi:hypothetical protein
VAHVRGREVVVTQRPDASLPRGRTLSASLPQKTEDAQRAVSASASRSTRRSPAERAASFSRAASAVARPPVSPRRRAAGDRHAPRVSRARARDPFADALSLARQLLEVLTAHDRPRSAVRNAGRAIGSVAELVWAESQRRRSPRLFGYRRVWTRSRRWAGGRCSIFSLRSPGLRTPTPQTDRCESPS